MNNCKICLNTDIQELIYPQGIYKCNFCGSIQRKNNVNPSFYTGSNYWYKGDESLKLHQKSRFVWFENYILDGKSIEFGAADGDFLFLVKNKKKNNTIFYSELVDMLRPEYENLSFNKIIGTIDDCNLSKFSNIFLIDVIEHLDDIRGSMSKLIDMLENNGRIFISTNNGDVFDTFLQLFYHQEHTCMLTKKGFEILCKDFSCTLIKIFEAPQSWLYVIIEKKIKEAI
jgi:hypothetical protein